MSTDIVHNGKYIEKLDKKLRYSKSKRDKILKAYRLVDGKMTRVSELTGIPPSTLYALIKQEDELKELIDEIDSELVEDLKEGALESLKLNIKDREQRAIEYALEKEPRVRRGRIRVNKSKLDGLSHAALVLGFSEEVEIE